MKDFQFLYATRFWALVVGAVSVYAKMKGWIGEAEMTLIATIMGGFIGIRTVDRATEQKILAGAVTSGQVQASTLLKMPPATSDTLTEPSTASVDSEKGGK